MRIRQRFLVAFTFCLQAVATSAVCFAHPGHGGHGHLGEAIGLADGIIHPFLGLDHILAMIAVGLLALKVGGRGLWCVPLAFFGSMMLGGASAAVGFQLPGASWAILISVVLFGALVAKSPMLSSRLAMALVSLFAAFHGQAHVMGMVDSTHWLPYLSGIGLATCAMQAAVVAVGLALRPMEQSFGLRLAGGVVAATGVVCFAMGL
jgi:urease accessory protein